MKEKRRFNRLKSKDKALLRIEGERQEEGFLLDVTSSGMRILLDKEIKVGTSLLGQFKIIPHIGHFYVRGEVVWVKKAAGGSGEEKNKTQAFETGIKFSKVSTIPF